MVVLEDGQNDFHYIGNPNSDKPIELKFSIQFDKEAFVASEEAKKKAVQDDFKTLYAGASQVYANYESINKILGTNVKSYELYKHFDKYGDYYLTCSVYEVDFGDTEGYPKSTQDDIEVLKESIKDYCLYMGEVGKHVKKYSETGSYKDLSEIERNNNSAGLEVISIQAALAEIASELDVDLETL